MLNYKIAFYATKVLNSAYLVLHLKKIKTRLHEIQHLALLCTASANGKNTDIYLRRWTFKKPHKR